MYVCIYYIRRWEILVGKPEEKRLLDYLGVNVKIILMRILIKYGIKV
jgi:hypothetical protein